VGLNLYVLKGVAPQVSLPAVLWGALPFVAIMIATMVLLGFVPGLATWLPDRMMGG